MLIPSTNPTDMNHKVPELIDPYWKGKIVSMPHSGTHPIIYALFTIRSPRVAALNQSPSTSDNLSRTVSRTLPTPLSLRSTSSSGATSATSFGVFGGDAVVHGGEAVDSNVDNDSWDTLPAFQSLALKLDSYAKSYVPKWLREPPAPLQILLLAPAKPFPPQDYASSVMLRKVTRPGPSACKSILTIPPYTAKAECLDSDHCAANPASYAYFWSSLLSLSLSAQVKDMANAMIHSVPLHLHEAAAQTYRIHIPGVRENSPRLAIGDRLMIRGIYPDQQLFSTHEVEVEVVGLAKAQGMVYIRSPQLGGLDTSLPKTLVATDKGDRMAAKYQIKFLVSVAPVCAMQDAVRAISLAMCGNDNSVAKRWTFPTIDDIAVLFPSPPLAIEWVDEALNDEQKNAVKEICNTHHRIPYLISGPPGTGKTKTLVEGVLQILATNADAAILLVAPSNTAADTLVRRLARHLTPDDMFRLNAPSRTFAEVHESIMLFCHIDGDQFSLPSFKKLMKYRVVVCGCADADILVNARATNQEMMKAETDFMASLHPRSKSRRQVFPHWTHLIVDEAGQASEPEIAIPLSVVLPYEVADTPSTADPVIILCGDIHQLGPLISSYEARQAELDISLLERLFNREVYYTPSHVTGLSKTSAHFIQNYRSIAPILMVPAAMFYNDTLQASATNVSLVKWSGLPNPKIPIAFYGDESEESWIDEGASWYNTGEINTTVNLIKSLLSERPDIKQKEIAVITPWREQVWRMRAKLRASGFGGVDVGNVETYQGAEFRVTIISCVRSRSQFLEEDKRNNMGLFNERKRFNVAITRAKELLVVVGNANLLKGDPFWQGFLQIMLRNNLYRGPRLDLGMSGAYISRIESAMRYTSEPNDNNGQVNDSGLYISGEMAREILRYD